MNLHEWAAKWSVPFEAVVDLQRAYGMEGTYTHVPAAKGLASEEAALVAVRLEAPRLGIRLWRNNVGALADKEGRFVRYGLANDSAAVNERIKSGDLIGIRPVVVTSNMVGHTHGIFVSREVKAHGWHYTDTPREQAQKRWLELVASMGGDAKFCTGQGSFTP